MPYVSTFDRSQLMMCTWDSFVDSESIARLIDAFVEGLDLTKYNVKEVATEGRPSYDPKGMYKLYIYGSRNNIRSSRKLAKSCRTNIEVKWLLGGVEPDFRTISDFRKNNIDSMKEIFREFNRRISEAVDWGFVSVDGSKFRANNSKDRNFTKNKLDDRIKWLNAHTDEYLRILKDADERDDFEEDPGAFTKEEIQAKLDEARERLAKYESYQKLMKETGASQLSLTDADSKLMKSKNGFMVSYNPQTAVDSETHLIRDFEMTNRVTDHGMLSPTLESIKNESPDGILEAVADKGYEDADDMVKCLENGIIPHVITGDGGDGYEIEISYQEAEADTKSTNPEELKKCLHAGKIPEVYKEVIEDMKVEEVRRKVKESSDSEKAVTSVYGTPEEMCERAKEGYFVRDPERNLVYCPAGEILRQKCVKKSGDIRYANKNACKHCPFQDKCYNGKHAWKEVDFSKDTLEKPCRGLLKAEEGNRGGIAAKAVTKARYEKVKVVKFTLKPNRKKTSMRMSLSEHPFGAIKRAMGASYFLLQGLRKVTGEFALFCLGYNFERAKNLLGFERMMELMTGA